MAEDKAGAAVGFLMWLLFGLAVWFMLPASWTDPVWYSTKYDVPRSKVAWKARPSDCDWLHAPLGGKSCHYKKTVTAYNEAGVPIGGDGALIFSRAKDSGRPIFSLDGGKTWHLLPADAPDPDTKAKRVEINWERIDD